MRQAAVKSPFLPASRPIRARQRRRFVADRPVFRGWAAFTAISVVCLVVVVWSGITMLQQKARLSSVRTEVSGLESDLATVQQRNDQLRAEVVRLGTDEYIETVARRQLGLIRPGEIPYMTVQTRSAASSGAVPHLTGGTASP